jgi:hypothetical protein
MPGALRHAPFPLTLLIGLSAAGQTIPPTYHAPRERMAWHREVENSESLDQLFPEQWQAWWNFMDGLRERGLCQQFCDGPSARRLVNALYYDSGNPHVNQANQGFLISWTARMTERWPPDRLLPDARDELLEGLRLYVYAGGGRMDPSTEAALATALKDLAPHDPEIQSVIEDLLSDSIVWADQVGAAIVVQDAIARRARDAWGDGFGDRYTELLIASPPARNKLPKPCQRALELLTLALQERLPARIREATEAVLSGCDDDAGDADLLNRLLLAYRILLQGDDLPQRAASYIDMSLVRLARATKRLRSARHWELWAGAVRSLGDARMSDELKRSVRGLLKRNDLPEFAREPIQGLAPLVVESREGNP